MSSHAPLGPRPGHPLAPRPLCLRDGDSRDLDSVMRIMESAFPPHFGEGWTRSQCAGILPMAGVTLRLAEDADGAEGFALVRHVADEAELLLIAVAPLAQGRGVGSALLEDFVQRARESGAVRVHLEVRDGNPAATLYRSLGFEDAGRRRDYYRGKDGTRSDAITLARAT